MKARMLTLAVCTLLLVIGGAERVPASSAAAGVVVSGTVSGSDQGPLSGASIEIDGPTHLATKTAADGRFALADVPRGRYKIRVAADEHLAIERDLDVGDAAVSMDIVLLHLPGLP